MKRNTGKIENRSPERLAARSVVAYPNPDAGRGTDFAGRRILVFALLVAGVLLWVALGNGRGIGWRRWAVVAAAAGTAMAPPLSRAIVAALEKFRTPTPHARARTALLLGILATAYFLFTAVHQDRDLFPKTHDDQSYLLQIRMLAGGRLWMPQHELADFFDTFYVLVRPKYASLYFPGAALLYVPTVWLGLPTWVMPILVAGSIVGLLYRIVTELLDGAAGLLAAFVLSASSWFRVYSVLLTSHEPMLLMGLLLFWAWLRWRRARHRAWLVAIGVFTGWGAITRPVDALCFAIPVGFAMAHHLLAPARPNALPGDAAERKPVARRLLVCAAFLLVGAAPFLALQLVFNHGVTGRWLKTPYALYLDQDQPGTSFGFHAYDPNARPRSDLPQKQDYYQTFFLPFIRDHQPGTFVSAWLRRYFPMIVDVTLPARPLLALLPLGLLGLTGRGLPGGDLRGRQILCSTLLLFVGLYAFNTFFLEHYALLIAPAVLVLLLSAGRSLERAWPARRFAIEAGFTVGLAVLCTLLLPELNALWGPQRHPEYVVSDETFPSPTMRVVHEMVEKYTGEPAVILFPYALPTRDRQGDPLYEDPVYNTESAWPDGARVVLARDLGPERNREIFAYYARTWPGRLFYRFDRNATRPDDKLVELGDARSLAAQSQAAPAVKK